MAVPGTSINFGRLFRRRKSRLEFVVLDTGHTLASPVALLRFFCYCKGPFVYFTILRVSLGWLPLYLAPGYSLFSRRRRQPMTNQNDSAIP